MSYRNNLNKPSAVKISAKEEAFCQAFVIKLDKTKSAIAAGYSKKSAKEIGYENLTKLHIQQRISEIRNEIKEKLGIDDHSVLRELAALAYWSIKDFIGLNNSTKDLYGMSKSKLKPVIGIKVKETSTTFDGETIKEVTTELKFADKRAALVDLGRHLGLFEKDNSQQSLQIKVTRK